MAIKNFEFFSNLTKNQLDNIADNRAEWLADYCPEAMFESRPGWMFTYRPEWTADHHPDYMMTFRRDWMYANRPEFVKENEIPADIVNLINE